MMQPYYEGTYPCIESDGPRSNGYGVASIYIGHHRYQVKQHRFSLEQSWGLTLRPGDVVRHACANPGCVNPLHLMVGTAGDNNRDTVAHGHNRKAQQTRCLRGHELTPDNLVPTPKRPTSRNCKRCHAIRERARRLRIKEASRNAL